MPWIWSALLLLTTISGWRILLPALLPRLGCRRRPRKISLWPEYYDIGAISLKDRLDVLSFEADSTGSHAELGYHLIRTFAAFSGIAPLVRYHHLQWENGKGLNSRGEKVPLLCHVLHLADRIAVLIDSKEEILRQSKNICRKIIKNSGKKICAGIC